MRGSQTLLALSMVAAAQAAVSWNQMGVYIEKNFDWVHVDEEIKHAIVQGYNRIYMGFYMSLYGCQGSCSAWVALPTSTQNDLLNYAHQNNAKIVLSVGGPGEFYEGIIEEYNTTATAFGTAAANFAKANNFDGIDYYVQLSGTGTRPSLYANNGSFADCVNTMVSLGHSVGFDTNSLTLTSPAPYFSPQFIQASPALQLQYSLSWFALNSNANKTFAVGEINMIMINEDNNYMSYQDIFIQNTYNDPEFGTFGLGSSVKEIASNGITASKIAIVKSIDPTEESVKSGYIDPTTLGSWGCNANSNFGWNGGYVGWTWNGQDTDKCYAWPGLLKQC